MMLKLPLCILRHDADVLMMDKRLLRTWVMDIVLVGLMVLNRVLRHFLADRFGSENGRIVNGRYLFWSRSLGSCSDRSLTCWCLLESEDHFLIFYFRREATLNKPYRHWSAGVTTSQLKKSVSSQQLILHALLKQQEQKKTLYTLCCLFFVPRSSRNQAPST